MLAKKLSLETRIILLLLIAGPLLFQLSYPGLLRYAATLALTGICGAAESEARMDNCLWGASKQEIALAQSYTARRMVPRLVAGCLDYAPQEMPARCAYPQVSALSSASGQSGEFDRLERLPDGWRLVRYTLFATEPYDVLYNADRRVVLALPEYE